MKKTFWMISVLAVALILASCGSSSDPKPDADGDQDLALDGDVDASPDGDVDASPDGDVDVSPDGDTSENGEDGDTEVPDSEDGDVIQEGDTNEDAESERESDSDQTTEPSDEESCLAEEDTCWIDGACRGKDLPAPDAPCRLCDPEENRREWSSAPLGQACDDSELCTHTDQCDGSGRCVGLSITCENDSSFCGAERACNGTPLCEETYTEAGTECLPPFTHGHSGCDGAGTCLASCDERYLLSNASATPRCLPGWTRIEAGMYATCAVLAGEMPYCWGLNESGQLGTGDNESSALAKPVVGMGDDKTLSLSMGTWHVCAVFEQSGTFCWGSNTDGQLGDETTESRNVPTRVSGLELIEPAQVVAGCHHSCVLDRAGDVYCWGSNEYGQLGYETTTLIFSYQPIPVLLSTAVELAAGCDHTCARLENGSVSCWGYNEDGELGDGDTDSRGTPAAVVGLPAPVKALGANHNHTCALLESNEVYCWGANGSGQLGDGSEFVASSSPVKVEGLLDVVPTALRVAPNSVCVLTAAGAPFCWGDNVWDRFAIGVEQATRAVRVADWNEDVDIAAGLDHACRLSAIGAITCRGGLYNGQLGDGREGRASRPMPVLAEELTFVGLGTSVTSMSFAVADGGVAYGFGGNHNHLIQQGSDYAGFPIPVELTAITGISVHDVRSGGLHACAQAVASDDLLCWGNNSVGQLGDGTNTAREVGTSVLGLPSGGLVSFALGTNHTCASMHDGNVYCWGFNNQGQLGTGTQTNQNTPAKVALAPTFGALQVTAGEAFACALGGAKQPYCWGRNVEGQLGGGSASAMNKTPIAVAGMADVVSIEAGGAFACAITSAHLPFCWGQNQLGQLGDGTTENRAAPVAVGGFAAGTDVAVKLALGSSHACALLEDGRVKCWGYNGSGQLGDGSRISRTSAVEVLGLHDAKALGIGNLHTCALRANGSAVCWGENEWGQLGIGYSTYSLESVPMIW